MSTSPRLLTRLRFLAVAVPLAAAFCSSATAADLIVQGPNSPYPFTTGTVGYDNIYVGQSANGTFNQSGGTLNVTTGQLFLGFNAGVTGTYNLSGGTLNTISTDVGDNGTGVFTLSGSATHNVTGNDGTANGSLDLGFYSGGSGTYNLNGGTLTSGYVRGGSGTSVFNFNGGTLTAGASATDFLQNLTHAYVGTGGALINTNGFNVTIAQNLEHTGGATTDGGLTKTGAGTLTLTGTNTYTGTTTVSAGTLALTGSVQSGGNSTLVVDGSSAAAATVSLSGSASLSTGIAYVGYGGTGTFNQTGGSFTANTISGGLYLGFSPGSSGTYNLSGSASSLSTSRTYVGSNGTGTFNQSGGSFTINGGGLFLGVSPGSSGTYNLSGSASSLSTYGTVVGNNGTGTFNQSGGSFTTNGGGLLLGNSLGSGTYNLSGGTLTTGLTQVSDGANTSSFTQTGGTHTTNTLALSGFSTSSQGTYTLAGGTLNTGSIVNHDPDNATVGTSIFHFAGGTLQAGASTTGFMSGLTTADVQAGGAKIDSNGFDITIAQNLVHDTTAGVSALDGGLTKLGAGTLTMTGNNTFTGPLTLNGGILQAAGESSLGAGNLVTVNGGGTLAFTGNLTLARTYNLGVSTLGVASGQTLTFGSGSVVSGGFLSGPGTDALGGGAAFNGVTTLPNSTLTQSTGTALLNTSTIRGTFTQTGGTLAFNNGLVLGSGHVGIGGTVNTTNTEIQGVTTINTGGALANSGGSLYLTGGSRTTINAGGSLSTASGTTIELNGSQLTNNGAEIGTLDVNYGSTASGSGSFGTVIVASGGKFSPGNSPGTATVGSLSLQSGGTYQFELNSAVAANNAPGSGADLISVSSLLTLSAGTTPNSRFTVAIVSLDANSSPALLGDFDASKSYRFVLATTGGIDGFNAAAFTVDTSGFGNNLAGGSFSVMQIGNNLDLVFTPVPEPATSVMLLIGLILVAATVSRRRRASSQLPNP